VSVLRQLFTASIGIAVWFAPAADAASIELQTRAQQHGAVLTLMQVASVSGSAQERRQLEALALPARGKVGDTVAYTRADIARQIASAQPQLRGAVQFAGAQRVLVERTGQLLPATQLLQTAQVQLAAALASYGGHIGLRALTAPRAVLVPAGHWQLAARPDSGIGPRMKVWLDVAVDGHRYTSVPVTFAVTWLRPALVLTRAQPAKAVLGADAVTVAEIDAAPFGAALLQDPQQLAGKRLRRAMNVGAVLSAEDIEQRPAIAAGSGVDVFAAVGRVVVQTRAIAERDGFIGQSIAARTFATNEPLMIEVIGEDRAIVSNNPTR
jgi:flagella basal body P-ring formation protein FlgA